MSVVQKGRAMESFVEAITWLFGTRTGVLSLLGGGILLFLVLAVILERRTKRRYFNHQKSDDDWDLFDDEEDA